MGVQYKFFHIRAHGTDDAEVELNRFLSSVRVVHVQRELVDCRENSFWAIAVEYLNGPVSDGARPEKAGGRKRIDYKEVLSPDDFSLFVRLRDWRKDAAAKEAVPVYTIFTNDQIAEMSRLKPGSLNSLMQIQGIGDARIKKYGDAVLAVISSHTPDQGTGENNETRGSSVSQDI